MKSAEGSSPSPKRRNFEDNDIDIEEETVASSNEKSSCDSSRIKVTPKKEKKLVPTSYQIKSFQDQEEDDESVRLLANNNREQTPERQGDLECGSSGRQKRNSAAADLSSDETLTDIADMKTAGELHQRSMVCCRALLALSDLDHDWSSRIARNNNTCIEAVFMCAPAHLFNRTLIIIPMAISVILGAIKYNYMLTLNGYEAEEQELTMQKSLSYGLCFFTLFALTLLVNVSSTQFAKYAIKRERPKRRLDTTRLNDLRGKETGTFAMPSGDSAAAAVFCYLVAYELGLPAVYLIMPLVMLGRVYYQCHWIGDTIVGFFFGTFWGLVAAANFDTLIPVFVRLVGHGSFQPIAHGGEH